MWACSAYRILDFIVTMAALSGHPALKAVSPQAPVTDWFIGDDFHHNGAFFQMDGFAFYSPSESRAPSLLRWGQPGLHIPPATIMNFTSKPAAFKKLAEHMGDSIKFWKDLYAHPNYDEWWQARNTRNFVNNVPNGTATMVVGGLFDAEDCFGAWETYKAIEQKAKNNNKIVMGPWYHGQWASRDGSQLGNVKFMANTAEWYQNNMELPFFNYYLKDKGDISKQAEATIFFTGENVWKQLPSWPPANSSAKPIYLQPDGKLGWDKPAAKSVLANISAILRSRCLIPKMCILAVL